MSASPASPAPTCITRVATSDVAAAVRVVVVAIEKDPIDGGDRPPVRGLEEAEADVLGRVLEPVQVAGDLAVGLQDQDDRRVRELLLALDVVVLEADGIGDAVDVGVVAEEERPARVRLGAAV